MTYSEQLKHPNWQRRRLERLSDANFTCESCADTQKTLHVHHRRYLKGRMAWEYDDEDLCVLCEDCHEEEHEARARLNALLSHMDVASIMVMTGYAEGLALRDSWGQSTALVNADSGEFVFGFCDAVGLTFHQGFDLFDKSSPVAGDVLWQRINDMRKEAGK